MNCPNCRHENPDDTLFCGQCGGPLKQDEGISVTKTLITPKAGLQKGNTLAGRYTIIEELGRDGMDVVYKGLAKYSFYLQRLITPLLKQSDL
ncbi:MAG: zinc ribbon domain-containing protein [Candidatus Aminicenantes bacterium]|nr:zinc ribbon domain-containing protein [Candidatus Aminicenantes bacterium]